MTSQFDFTNAEWSDIAVLPVLVGFAVARAEDSGRLGSLRELRTLASSIAHKAPDNEATALIEAASTVDVKVRLEAFEDHDPELLADVAVRASVEVAKVLYAKATSAEADAYLRWVHDIGSQVANAAKEHGVRVSAPEEALLERLASALDQHIG